MLYYIQVNYYIVFKTDKKIKIIHIEISEIMHYNKIRIRKMLL